MHIRPAVLHCTYSSQSRHAGRCVSSAGCSSNCPTAPAKQAAPWCTSVADDKRMSAHTGTVQGFSTPTQLCFCRGIFCTGSSLLGAALRAPHITSKNLIRCAHSLAPLPAQCVSCHAAVRSRHCCCCIHQCSCATSSSKSADTSQLLCTQADLRTCQVSRAKAQSSQVRCHAASSSVRQPRSMASLLPSSCKQRSRM